MIKILVCNYSADLIWHTKMPGLAPALKGDRSFSVFFPFRACPALFAGARAETGENVDFPNAAE